MSAVTGDKGDVLEMGPPEAIFDALERVNQAIAGARDSTGMLAATLDALLEIFECDRAWLLYPCSATVETFSIPMERTRPEWPGAAEVGVQLPNIPATRALFELCLQQTDPVPFDADSNPAGEEHPTFKAFQIKSQLVMTIYPVGDQPWMLGIHHCARPRIYRAILPLFRAIGRRLADGLSRHLALSEMQKSEERFRLLVENAPEAIVLIDVRTGRFVDVNSNAERLFEMPREELLQVGPHMLSPPRQGDGSASVPALERHIQSTLEGVIPTFEWTFSNGSGDPVECEIRLIKLPGDPFVRGSISNIAGRKLAEREKEELHAQLVQAQKMEALGQLTGGVAHDFNNLLTVIFGNLDLLRLDTNDDPTTRAAMARIEQAADRARSLTHRLLAFARKQPLRPSVFDPGVLLRGMDDMLRRTLGESISLEIVLGGGLWTCSADSVQLENALLNLAINARDAMPNGGRLTIEASNARLDRDYARENPEVVAGQYVVFAVTDSGYGISAELLDRVLAPFFTTKAVGKGSGLGLSMVFGFAKQSGGHLKIYSEEGHGTTVKIYLPRGRGVAMPPSRRRDDLVLGGQGETILLVEDDDMVRQVVAEQLEQLGYRVLSAADGTEALGLLGEHSSTIRLLLTDVILSKGMKGTELAQRAVEARRGLPVVYMSGYTENAIIHNGRLDPGVELLEKPFERAALARSLRNALDGSSLEEAALDLAPIKPQD